MFAFKKVGAGLWVLLLFLVACGTGPTGEDQDKYHGIVEGVDFEALFAPPEEDELDQVEDEWAQRTIAARDITEIDTTQLFIGTQFYQVRIVSHRVNGVRHYGAIIVPPDVSPGSLPLLLYTHGGDEGVNLNQIAMMSFDENFAGLVGGFVLAVPSFRSEPLVYGDSCVCQSGGAPSPWDWDVDDALSLMEVAFATTPAIDTTQVAVLGASRGACVGMLMSIRDPRIDGVVEFFGPSDFFGEYVRNVAGDALTGQLRDLPGLDYLNSEFLQPLKNGDITIDQMRIEMVRRSPVYFLERMAPLQVHHGKKDDVVDVSQARRLMEMANELELSAARFEAHIYADAGHDEKTFEQGMSSVVAFLQNILNIPVQQLVWSY